MALSSGQEVIKTQVLRLLTHRMDDSDKAFVIEAVSRVAPSDREAVVTQVLRLVTDRMWMASTTVV
jgi:hypothetical protein